MPPKQASGARNRPQAGSSRQAAAAAADSSDAAASSDPFDSGDNDDDHDDHDDSPPRRRATQAAGAANSGGDAIADKSIPKDLLTRILHDLFEKDATRVSRDANAAVGKYVDVFVREAIARAAVEKRSGFLEVEDLEKIAPQLLLDL